MSNTKVASPAGGWLFALRALDELGGEATTRAISAKVQNTEDVDMLAGLKTLKWAQTRYGVVRNTMPGRHPGRLIPDGVRWAITDRGRAYLDGRARLVRPPSGPRGGTMPYVFEEVPK